MRACANWRVPVLQGGMHVVLDATFLKRSERDAARALAAAQRVPFRLLDFPVDAAVLRQRLRARALRGGEVSEADEAVLQAQLLSAEPLQPDELATVHVCRQAAEVGTGAPEADWQPLLRALADESAQLAGAANAADAGPDRPGGQVGRGGLKPAAGLRADQALRWAACARTPTGRPRSAARAGCTCRRCNEIGSPQSRQSP